MSKDTPPKVVVIAGPNGAGKSTVAPRLLRGPLGVSEFVNADTIAMGLSRLNPDSRDLVQIEADSKAIEAAIHAAVRDALIEHKRLGQPIVVADEKGNVIWVPAKEIQIPNLASQSESITDTGLGLTSQSES